MPGRRTFSMEPRIVFTTPTNQLVRRRLPFVREVACPAPAYILDDALLFPADLVAADDAIWQGSFKSFSFVALGGTGIGQLTKLV